MRKETLIDAIGKIDDDLIFSAAEKRRNAENTRAKRINIIRAAGAAAACAALCFAALTLADKNDIGEISEEYQPYVSSAEGTKAPYPEKEEAVTAGTSAGKTEEPAGGYDEADAAEENTAVPMQGEALAEDEISGETSEITAPPKNEELTKIHGQAGNIQNSAGESDNTSNVSYSEVMVYPDRLFRKIKKEEGLLSSAYYPEAAEYPIRENFFGEDENAGEEKYMKALEEWQLRNKSRLSAGKYIDDGINSFYKRSAAEFLYDKDGKNHVYSPVNTYIALAALAEASGGNSRAQLLSLLCEDDMISLRSQAKNLWNASYRKDGLISSVPANSLWLNNSLIYDPETAVTLSSYYKASVYGGKLYTYAMNKMLRKWIRTESDGFLSRSAANAGFSKDTVLSLCSAMYFSAEWTDAFCEDTGKLGIFRGKKGNTAAEFMNMTDAKALYFTGENYTAVRLELCGGGGMWFILPEEGVAAGSLIRSGGFIDMISGADENGEIKEKVIDISVPKFDILSETELEGGLKNLGVTDIFDENAADFSALSGDMKGVFLNGAKHIARVKTDENGSKAASAARSDLYGAEGYYYSGKTGFILDRPFIFAIMSDTDQPLLIGIVNEV